MPGGASLAAGRYYAHPANRFWPLLAAIFGWPAGLDPQACYERLGEARIALWDVLASCRRTGSADAAIRDGEVNDFSAFFRTYPHIEKICCNGKTAARLFLRAFPHRFDRPCLVLPSTSPANAALPEREKLRLWGEALRSLSGGLPAVFRTC